jgi:hypothetical protein
MIFKIKSAMNIKSKIINTQLVEMLI